MNQDQQDKDITEVVETTSNNASIESITKQDELTLEQMEEVVGGIQFKGHIEVAAPPPPPGLSKRV